MPSRPPPVSRQFALRASQSAIKSDPYANKTHRRIDLALVAITLLLLFVAFRFSAHSRTTSSTPQMQQQAQSNH